MFYSGNKSRFYEQKNGQAQFYIHLKMWEQHKRTQVFEKQIFPKKKPQCQGDSEAGGKALRVRELEERTRYQSAPP